MNKQLKYERYKKEAEKLYPGKSLAVGYLLFFFLGGLGAHRFYYGKTSSAILQIVLALAIFPTMGITALALGVWLLCDLFLLPSYNREHNNWCNEGQFKFLEDVMGEES